MIILNVSTDYIFVHLLGNKLFQFYLFSHKQYLPISLCNEYAMLYLG